MFSCESARRTEHLLTSLRVLAYDPKDRILVRGEHRRAAMLIQVAAQRSRPWGLGRGIGLHDARASQRQFLSHPDRQQRYPARRCSQPAGLISRFHPNTWFALPPCLRATRATDAPGPRASSTINRRSSALRRRRRRVTAPLTPSSISTMQISSSQPQHVYMRPRPDAYSQHRDRVKSTRLRHPMVLTSGTSLG